MGSILHKTQSPNLMNLSRVSNPPKNRFQLSAGLNLETLNAILSGTNHIWSGVSNLSRGSNSLNLAFGHLIVFIKSGSSFKT